MPLCYDYLHEYCIILNSSINCCFFLLPVIIEYGGITNRATPGRICLGDTIAYSCSVLFASESLYLTWRVTYTGDDQAIITLNQNSAINVINDVNDDISAVLDKYETQYNYIESTVTVTVLSNIYGTEVRCEKNSTSAESVNVNILLIGKIYSY